MTVSYGAVVVRRQSEDRHGDIMLDVAAAGAGRMYSSLLFETVCESTLEFGEDEEQHQLPGLAS